MIVLGIDPGLQSGVAIYANGALNELMTAQPKHVEHYIKSVNAGLVVFEDSRLQSTVFAAPNAGPRVRLKVARNIGEIDAQCREIEALCAALGIRCIGVSPRAKGKKLNAAEFAALTGWEYRTNQHQRDAAMVAWPYRNARA